MTLETVSDIFAFVCKNADFTNSILFAETEVPEIRPEERDAIGSVERHLRESYVGLLNACRDDMYARADDELKATMGRNWNRDDSIWERGRVELPLLIESSYVEIAYAWIGEEETRLGQLSLVSEIWVQKRRRGALCDVESRLVNPVVITPDKKLRVIADITEGARFQELARSVVAPLWPFAIDVRSALLRQGKGPTRQGPS
jgi:hypothetical protein